MLIQRSIPIILEKSEDLLKTVEEFNRYQKSISEICFNFGETRSALALHKEVCKSQPSSLCAQMKCSAIRLVASSYVSAKSNKKLAERPFIFRKKKALFLIGKRGRDAFFSKDRKVSIWTVGGRKKLGFRIPAAFQKDFSAAKLCKWVPKDSVMALEGLKIKKVSKKEHVRKGTRRKLNSFCYSLLIQGITNRAQRDGIGIEFVNPAYTSQTCNICGLLGDRIGSKFFCPNRSHRDCADRNASLNVLLRFTVLRGGAHQSTCAEDRTSVTVKPSPLGEGS
jgi:IS605 OrfB family transposase